MNTASIWSELGERARHGVYNLVGSGGPLSGTSGTGVNIAGAGSFYFDKTNQVVYINEGDKATPYWTPVSFTQRGLISWHSDFRDGVGKAVSDTAVLATLTGSGIKIFGQGIAETDSGFVPAIGEGGAVGTLTTTDEASHTAAIGVGLTTSLPFQPDTHGPIVVDALVAQSSAITLRTMFFGFAGALADALDPIVTGSGTTLTLVLDDLAGLYFDVGLTDTDRYFAPHNKSNEAATIATTATGVDTGVDVAVAGTYQRLRVQISAAGVMTCFVNKAQVSQISAALDVDEEVGPVLCLSSTSTAVKSALVKHFSAWGTRG